MHTYIYIYVDAKQRRRPPPARSAGARYVSNTTQHTSLYTPPPTPNTKPLPQRRAARLAQQHAAIAAATARLRALQAQLHQADAAATAAGKARDREAAVEKEVEAAYAGQMASLRAMRAQVRACICACVD